MTTSPRAPSRRLSAALERAAADAALAAAAPAALSRTPPDGRRRACRLAIGDPQAPLERFLYILDRQGALADDGRLRPDVFLLSMGDHFDWGRPEDRPAATRDSLALLAWLAAHPPDQAVLLAGNHDLARVCELASFASDDDYAAARDEADRAYRPTADPAREALFLARYPQIASAEILARDYSDFTTAQRGLVSALLRAGRLRLAHAEPPDLLFVHAGVSRDDLAAVGLHGRAASDALAAATALDAHLAGSVARWACVPGASGAPGSPLDLMPLHQAGTAAAGEGRGILYQRPSDPDNGGDPPAHFAGPPRRRFDPRGIPLGLVQAIGHIKDDKCRQLLPRWLDPAEPELDGPLRALVTDGRSARYGRALAAAPEVLAPSPATAAILFIDGGMNHADPDRYDLLDLATRRAAVPRSS